MQKPSIILDILNKQSSKNYNIKNIYHHLYNKQFYIEAYYNLTKSTKEILPKYLNRIDDIIKEMKSERYSWSKTNSSEEVSGGLSNLKISEWKDLLVQEVLRMILSSIYEDKFLDSSHWMIKNRDVSTALKRVYTKSQACEFFIEGSINSLFNSFNYTILDILRKTMSDNRFIELIRKFLKAGKFGKDLIYTQTYSGIPYGNGLTPLLSNIFLNELDNMIDCTFNKEFNRESSKQISKEYNQIKRDIENRGKSLKNPNSYRFTRKHQTVDNIKDELKELRKKLRHTPCRVKTEDSNYRRFSYTRYANTWIISFTGTFNEANDIAERIKTFIFEKLNLSSEYRVVNSYTKKSPARFLNYELITQWSNTHIIDGKRINSGQIAFLVPERIIRDRMSKYLKDNKPIHLVYRQNESVFDIIKQYQSEYSGFMQYYKYARNQQALTKLKYVTEISLTKTLASKLKISVPKVYKRFGSTCTYDGKTYKVLKTFVITNDEKIIETHFGAIPFKRIKYFEYNRVNDFINQQFVNRNSYSFKLQNNKCLICESTKNIVHTNL